MAALKSTWLLCSLAATALAQGGTTIIPAALTTGFTSSIGLEVSYQGTASRFDGIQDGSTVAAAAVASDPIFALSDESGINTRISFLVMMLDTTDAAAPVLHFAQDQFKADGEQTGISSQAPPLVPYARPGSLGETGRRQYSFLLFQQTAGAAISGLPRAGQTLDVEQFLTANSMRAARAGVGFLVDTSGSGGGGGSAAPSAPATTEVSPTNTPIAPSNPPVAPSNPPVVPSNTLVAPINTPIATFSSSVIPTPPAATPEAPVPTQPSSPAAPLPSSAGSPPASATPSGSGPSGGGASPSSGGTATAGGSALEVVSARALAAVAGFIGGLLLI